MPVALNEIGTLFELHDADFFGVKIVLASSSVASLRLPRGKQRRVEALACGERACLLAQGQETMTMTMTHSEKSHICQMRAWPYRQERRGHGPTKKNLSYR